MSSKLTVVLAFCLFLGARAAPANVEKEMSEEEAAEIGVDMTNKVIEKIAPTFGARVAAEIRKEMGASNSTGDENAGAHISKIVSKRINAKYGKDLAIMILKEIQRTIHDSSIKGGKSLTREASKRHATMGAKIGASIGERVGIEFGRANTKRMGSMIGSAEGASLGVSRGESKRLKKSEKGGAVKGAASGSQIGSKVAERLAAEISDEVSKSIGRNIGSAIGAILSVEAPIAKEMPGEAAKAPIAKEMPNEAAKAPIAKEMPNEAAKAPVATEAAAEVEIAASG